ncbi:MAG: glycosyltransferase family 2 protein [Pseudomonadota bacterium]
MTAPPPADQPATQPATLPTGQPATQPAAQPATLPAAVVIGRNEGARLAACLASLQGQCAPVVYVDSGSTDGSVALARAAGAAVVELDLATPFTAARARNAGVAALTDAGPSDAGLSDAGLTDAGLSDAGPSDAGAYVQFVDGDCTVEPGWVATARAFLDANADAAVACGRRRETAPEASVFNRLCDLEWNTPVGEARACGGDALVRLSAFRAIGGFDGGLIAGEEPEMCLRLRRAGWRIHRLDAPMTRHDAAIASRAQWRKRCERAGWAAAEGAWRHGRGPERYNVARVRSLVIWGLGPPAALAVLGLLALAALVTPGGWPWAALPGAGAAALALLLRAQDARVARYRVARHGDSPQDAALYARWTRRAKWHEARGALRFLAARLTGRAGRLIEYKGPAARA